MPLQTPPVKYDLIRLSGGLDQVTPTLSLPPGVCRRAANFECSINGGYTRIAGYERYDGRPNPSDANYNILTCSLTGSVSVGDTVVGLSSAATGKCIARSGNDVVITRETGVFVAQEGISVSAAQVGTITQILGVAANGLTDAQYRALAADDYRADIHAVPGSGPILGVAYYDGVVYAWRNNAGNTAAAMYKSTASGWSLVNLGYEVPFNTGSGFATNDVVVGATSGATATIRRVVRESGTFSGGDAVGRLLFASVTGTFQSGENLRVGGVTKGVATAGSTAITLTKDGRVETAVGNFGGGDVNKKLYGCDGKNRAFEWDGEIYVPIATGMSPDTPTHVAFHKQHLFLAFGHSLQFSAIGNPFQWSPLLGAGELAMNDDITNLLVMPGDQTTGALAVYTRNDTSILYGTDSSTFKLSSYNTGTGAIAYTAQNMDQTYVLDDRGIMALQTSLNFGNFLPASLTMNLRPFVQQHRNLATASVVDREKGQYRVFFSDSTALYTTVVNGKVLGTMPIQFSHPVTCACEGETPDGSEASFFGSTNGFVYRLDAGTSFDGGVIPANINLVYNSIGSPRVLKRYRKAMVELTGNSYAEIAFGYDLGYRTLALLQPVDASYSKDLRSAFWDDMVWDNFVWDGEELSPAEIEVTGTAENMSIRVTSVSALFKPFTVNNIIIHYTPRRGLR
jgi:hypothetical protein